MTDTKADKKTHKARLRDLELREKELDVEKAELSVATGRASNLRHQHQHSLYYDIRDGVFRLEAGVYEEALGLVASLDRWSLENPGRPITLHLFSPGGSVLHGIALYDALRTLSARGHQVTTQVRGFAGSMASVIFLAGDVRRIGAESLVHQHEPSAMTLGRLSDMVDNVEFVKRLYAKITNLYVTRTNVSQAQFVRRTKGKEWWCDSTEALKLGIATEVG